MHFWNKITKMDWDNLPDIRCSWLADSQQETLLTVGRSCLLMVVWCRFFTRLRLRFSACFVRDNCQCHVENKEEWKVNCQNRNCRKLFCFFWVFLSMFWENWVILPLGSPDWMLLSVLAVAKPRFLSLIDRLTKDFAKRQEIIRDRFDSFHSDSISAVHVLFLYYTSFTIYDPFIL